jgi:hypothetical protein
MDVFHERSTWRGTVFEHWRDVTHTYMCAVPRLGFILTASRDKLAALQPCRTESGDEWTFFPTGADMSRFARLTLTVILGIGAAGTVSVFGDKLDAEVPAAPAPKSESARGGLLGGDYFAQLAMRYMIPSNLPWRETAAIVDRHLTQEIDKEVKRLQGMDGKRARSVTSKIRGLLLQQFELHQKAGEREIQDLEAQITKRRLIQAQRENDKDKMVNDRIDHLLRGAAGVGWGLPDSAAN